MTVVFVCSDCKRHECVERPLRKHTDAEIRRVKCQKVCDRPVAGLVVNGRFEWFGRLDKAKPLAGLLALAKHDGKGKVVAPLEKRRSRKRSGRSPR